jgi:hypothetical protein
MKNVLSFIFGVALGGSILFWGPQNGHLSEYDPAAIENSIGSISHPGIPADTPCPYLQGKMGQSAGTGQSACPYLNEMKDKTTGGCPYLEGKIQKSCPTLNANVREI